MKLLILIGLVLLIIAVHQLMRVIELSREFKKGNEWSPTDSDNSFNGKLMLIVGVLFFVLLLWQIDLWEDNSLPSAASVHGLKIDSLWNINMWIITIASVLTNGVLFYFAYKYSGKKGNKATYLAHDNRLEMAWTIVPAVVLAGVY